VYWSRRNEQHVDDARSVDHKGAPIMRKTFKDHVRPRRHQVPAANGRRKLRRYVFVTIDRATGPSAHLRRSERGRQHRSPATAAQRRGDEDRQAAHRQR